MTAPGPGEGGARAPNSLEEEEEHDVPASSSSSSSMSSAITTSEKTKTSLFLIPKMETGAWAFRQQHPYHGQGVKMAILDSGLDPSCFVVPKTTTTEEEGDASSSASASSTSLIHLMDCSGSGDVALSPDTGVTWVPTSTTTEEKEQQSPPGGEGGSWQVVGLTGRTLRLNPSWNFQPFPSTTSPSSATTPSSSTFIGGAAAAAADPATDPAASTSSLESPSLPREAPPPLQEPFGTPHTPPTSPADAAAAIPPALRGPVVRLGLKRAYELFPGKLVERVKAERRSQLERQLDAYRAALLTQLAQWGGDTTTTTSVPSSSSPTELDHPPTDASNHSSLSPFDPNDSSTHGPVATPISSSSQKRKVEDLRVLYTLLTDHKDWLEDPGPVYDIVVFYDGTQYRAALDGQEQGDLTSAPALAAFHRHFQYATTGTVDQYVYAFDFFEQGTILSVIGDVSPHASHVAGICSAAEEVPAQQGVAPAAQLLSFKIGDVRLETMETGPSLTRGWIGAVRQGCHVINLSYGEGCAVPNRGRLIDLAEEVVWKHSVIFVSSAGNNGPALSTVGAPGGTCSACIGVGAYVSTDMMRAEYSMALSEADLPGQDANGTTLAGTTYTWSSVGPTADGDWGVCVIAPGAAITKVSRWCLQRSTLMNGTSMSSPNAAGCVALLVSACLAEKVPVSPARIRRALTHTARKIPHLTPLQQGHGMIQVDQAWEYLKAFKDDPTEDIFFAVEVSSAGSGRMRGVYLRQPHESSTRHTFSVLIEPQFRREDQVSEEIQRQRIDLEMNLVLQSTEPWVTAPQTFVLVNNGRSFNIDVDPTQLEPGVHTASVVGLPAGQPERGAWFTVPITVVKPLAVQTNLDFGALSFAFAEVKRFFVVPPMGATWMDVMVKDLRDPSQDADSASKMVVLHTVQLLPHAAYRDFEKQKYLSLLPGQTLVTSIAVELGVTCEMALARYWSTMGTVQLEASVHFHGVRPVPDQVDLVGGNFGTLIRIMSDLQDETINPTAKLTTWLTPIRPKADAIISPVGERDVFPSHEKAIYQLVMSYEFEQEEAGSFIPRAAGLQGVLYESAFESQMLLVFDSEKKYLGCADAWPSAIKAPKGTITIRAQIRHCDATKLEKLKDMMIWIERTLEKEIQLSAYPTKESLMIKDGAFKKRILRKGTGASVFFAEPAASKIPSGCKAGDLLTGSATFAAGESSLPGEGKRPGGFPVRYVVGPKAKKVASESESPGPEEEKSTEEKLEEAIRDLKVSHLGKLTKKEKEEGKFDLLYAKMETEYPDHLPLRMAKLKYLDTHPKRKEMLKDISEAAEGIISRISGDELALHFGRKLDPEDVEANKVREKMKEKKGLLIEALARLALAYADMDSDGTTAKFDATLKDIKSWVDISSGDKYAALVLEREIRAGRYGIALKLINKLLGKESKDDGIKPLSRSELLDKRAQIFEKLGYTLLMDYDKKNRVIASPKSFALF